MQDRALVLTPRGLLHVHYWRCSHDVGEIRCCETTATANHGRRGGASGIHGPRHDGVQQSAAERSRWRCRFKTECSPAGERLTQALLIRVLYAGVLSCARLRTASDPTVDFHRRRCHMMMNAWMRGCRWAPGVRSSSAALWAWTAEMQV